MLAQAAGFPVPDIPALLSAVIAMTLCGVGFAISLVRP